MNAAAYRTDPRPIVVGIDGSPNAAPALEWALREGARLGCDVEVVHTWHRLSATGTSYGSERTAAEYVAAEVRAALAAVAADLPDGPAGFPTVIELTAQGSAARTLVDRAAHARLLVLGQSRHVAVPHLLPGSVGAICARRSAAPVVLVPEQGDAIMLDRQPVGV